MCFYLMLIWLRKTLFGLYGQSIIPYNAEGKKKECLFWRVHSFNCCLFFICWKGFSVTQLILHSYLKFLFFLWSSKVHIKQIEFSKIECLDIIFARWNPSGSKLIAVMTWTLQWTCVNFNVYYTFRPGCSLFYTW